MRKERAMRQTVILIHDDRAKARRVADALFDFNDCMWLVETDRSQPDGNSGWELVASNYAK
jgi:hypothetical protein